LNYKRSRFTREELFAAPTAQQNLSEGPDPLTLGWCRGPGLHHVATQYITLHFGSTLRHELRLLIRGLHVRVLPGSSLLVLGAFHLSADWRRCGDRRPPVLRYSYIPRNSQSDAVTPGIHSLYTGIERNNVTLIPGSSYTHALGSSWSFVGTRRENKSEHYIGGDN